jgi:predicted phage terminase large subunit-like protein
MQRISDSDFTQHLLDNSDEQWHHLILPSYIDKKYTYSQNGIYIKHNLDAGTLWNAKANNKLALKLMTDIQYSQDPVPEKGEMVEQEWFLMYDELPEIKEYTIYCDTASKTNKYNDYSVFGLFGKCYENKGYLIKMYRGKVKVPQLKSTFTHFYNASLEVTGVNSIKVSIEDKDSGVGLIQALQDDGEYFIKPIQRREGKYARLLRSTTKIKDHIMHLKRNDEMTGIVISEFVKFKADDSHKHDDTVDVVVDFINNEIPDKATPSSAYIKGI